MSYCGSQLCKDRFAELECLKAELAALKAECLRLTEDNERLDHGKAVTARFRVQTQDKNQ